MKKAMQFSVVLGLMLLALSACTSAKGGTSLSITVQETQAALQEAQGLNVEPTLTGETSDGEGDCYP